MLRRRAAIPLLFLLPIAYVGLIASVAVHEILGHGLAAAVLGGRFTGFRLMWDGMGYASAWPADGAPLSHTVAVLLAGSAAGMLVGLLALACALLARRSLAVRMAWLVFALHCLLDGAYVFWSAYHQVPPGDLARVLNLLAQAGVDSQSWRVALMIVGALAAIGATIGVFALLFQSLEETLAPDARLVGWTRAAALAVFLALPGVISWWTFDWNQLAPGIGTAPNIVGAASVVIVAAGLYWMSIPPRPSIRLRHVRLWYVVTSWSIGAATLLCLAQWLADGVSWS